MLSAQLITWLCESVWQCISISSELMEAHPVVNKDQHSATSVNMPTGLVLDKIGVLDVGDGFYSRYFQCTRKG